MVCRFTTEKAAQLPNAGFEKWHGSKPTYVYESGGTMFWDTGNHGSQKAGTDITTADGSVKHGGSYSAKLESKFASMLGIGQFAAGNVFSGKYLATNMDGVVVWCTGLGTSVRIPSYGIARICPLPIQYRELRQQLRIYRQRRSGYRKHLYRIGQLARRNIRR